MIMTVGMGLMMMTCAAAAGWATATTPDAAVRASSEARMKRLHVGLLKVAIGIGIDAHDRNLLVSLSSRCVHCHTRQMIDCDEEIIESPDAQNASRGFFSSMSRCAQDWPDRMC